MTDKPDVDLERANKVLDELFRAHYSGEEAKSFRHALRRNFASALAAEFRAVRLDELNKVAAGACLCEEMQTLDKGAVCWIHKRITKLEAK